MNFFEGVSGAALSGAGAGLADSQNKLLSAAREQREAPVRALNLQTAQEQAAMSHDAFVKWQDDQKTVPTEELIKTNPLGADLLNIGAMSGKIEPNKDKYTKGEIKQIQQFAMQNPHLLQGPINDKIKAADDMSKKYDITLGKLNEKMQKLNEDPVGNEEAIAKLTGEIKQRQQEQAEINAGRDKFKAMGTNLAVFKTMNDRKNMTKDDLVISDMRMKQGFSGDAEDVVKWNLEHKPGSTESVPGEYHVTAQTEFGKNWKDLTQPEKKKVKEIVQQDEIKKNIAKQASGMEGIDIPDLAASIKNGESSISQIKNTRGQAITNKVMSEVRKEYPHFNFIYAEANSKYLTSTANQRIIGAVDASLPRVNRLADQAERLKNTPIPKWNSVLKTLSIETGDSAYTNFMSNRNAIVQEVNTALSGSSQSSDMRVKIELENLQAAKSPAQLAGAISNLREALIARKDASTQFIYPLEVVRGEKTKKQWDEEQKKLYRGKYGTGGAGAETASSSNPFDNP